MERMQYTPSIKLCVLVRGTLANGKPSRASYWSIVEIRQFSHDRQYFFGRDTYDHQNPFIYYRPHLEEHANYYKAQLRKWLGNFFPITPALLRRKNLRNPITVELRQFDTIDGRKVYSNELRHDWTWEGSSHEAQLEAAWQAIVDCQCASSDQLTPA